MQVTRMKLDVDSWYYKKTNINFYIFDISFISFGLGLTIYLSSLYITLWQIILGSIISFQIKNAV